LTPQQRLRTNEPVDGHRESRLASVGAAGAPNEIRIRAAGLKGRKYLQNSHEWCETL